MKKIMRRLLGGVLALTMLLTVIPAPKAEAASAKKINVNKSYNYELGDDEEKMLKFTAPSDGFFTVSLKVNSYEYGNDVEVKILDSNGNEILDEIETNSSVKSTIYATKGKRNFYLKVASDFDYCDFNVRVNFTKSSSWENELNDTSTTARSLTAKKWKYGVITTDDTYDFYKFKLKKNSKVKVTFGPKVVSGDDNAWSVEVINSYGESCTLYNETSVSTQKTDTLYLKKGTYYLRVQNSYSATYVPYKIKYTASSFAVKTPAITKVSVKKMSYSDYRYLNYITLKKQNDVDGFSLQVAKKKSMKGKLINDSELNIKNSSYISKTKINYDGWAWNSTLSTQKKYYARVRAYVYDPFGAKIYGKWSKVKAS